MGRTGLFCLPHRRQEKERRRGESGSASFFFFFHLDALVLALSLLAAIDRLARRAFFFFLPPSIDPLSFSRPLPPSSSPLSTALSNRKKPSVDGGAAGAPKKDFTTAILERKKSPNRLIVDDATNDDNR